MLAFQGQTEYNVVDNILIIIIRDAVAG